MKVSTHTIQKAPEYGIVTLSTKNFNAISLSFTSLVRRILSVINDNVLAPYIILHESCGIVLEAGNMLMHIFLVAF